MRHVFRGNGVPDFTPTALGQHYIDTSTAIHYNSVGVTGPKDWKAGGGSSSGPTYLSNLVNAQVYLTHALYKERMTEQVMALLPSSVYDEEGNFIDPNMSLGVDMMVSGIMTEHFRKFSSGAVVDLSHGTSHLHSVTDKQTAHLSIRSGVDPSIKYTTDVYPISEHGRDIRYAAYPHGLLVWDEVTGVVWFTDTPHNPMNGKLHKTKIDLQSGETLSDATLSKGYRMMMLTSAGRCVMADVEWGFRDFDIIDDWTVVGLTNEEISDTVSFGDFHRGVGDDEVFLHYAGSVYYTPDGGSSWFNVGLPSLEDGRVWARFHKVHGFKSQTYLLGHQADQSGPHLQTVHRFDAVNKTWTLVHSYINNTINSSGWYGADEETCIVGSGEEETADGVTTTYAYQTTDGDTWERVALALDPGTPMYFHTGSWYYSGTWQFHISERDLFRSNDGVNWECVGQLPTRPANQNFVMIPIEERLSWDVELESCIGLLGYQRDHGFSVHSYEPDFTPEPSVMETEPLLYIHWFQGTLDIHVMIPDRLERPEDESLEDDPMSMWLPKLKTDVVNYEVLVQLPGMPEGIHPKLIHIKHYTRMVEEMMEPNFDPGEFTLLTRNNTLEQTAPDENMKYNEILFGHIKPKYTKINSLEPTDGYLTPGQVSNEVVCLNVRTFAYNWFHTYSATVEMVPFGSATVEMVPIGR